jgi:GNAT superfamily N-acetyltransferase
LFQEVSETITYAVNRTISVDQFRELLNVSTLGERRPVGDATVLAAMLQNASLLVTAWDGELLVGVSRCLCDFAFANYCSDLAVHSAYQRHGIGRELLKRSLDAGGCKLILLSAPAAASYYPHIGLTQHPSAWVVDPGGLG